MAMDSGDGVQETAKRKVGDSEPGEGEDSRDKKNRTGKEEERGARRSVDDWEELAKRLKTSAEARAEESKNSGEGMATVTVCAGIRASGGSDGASGGPQGFRHPGIRF